MEEVSLQIEKLTGHADNNTASGVFSARVSFVDGSIGTLVSCILVKGNGEVGVSSLLREIFDIANKKLESAETGSLNVLRSCVAASVEFVSSKNLEASFCFTLFYKNASYIFRSGDKIKVWAYLNSTSQELTFEHGSGHLNLGQIILLATEKFLSSFDVDVALREKDVDLDELVDGLATEISAKEDQSEIAAAIVLVKGELGKDATAGVASDSDSAVVEEEDTLENVRSVGEEIPADQKHPLDPAHEIAAHAVTTNGAASLPSESSAVVTSVEVYDRATVKPQSEFAANTQVSGPDAHSKFKNLLPSAIGAISSEASKLKRGDIGAIFRLRRNVVIAAVVILLVLAGSVSLALRNSANSEKQSEFESYFSAATSKYEEGLAIISLNQEKARTLLVDADNEIKKALAVKSNDKKAIELQSQIAAKLKETENLSSVQFSTFVEVDGNLVALLKSSDNLIGVASSIYVIDGDGSISSEVEGKSATVDASFYDNKVFAFDGSSINKVDLAGGSADKIVDVKDARDISVFLGNVYILGNNQIFKYVPIEAGFAESVNYLNQSEEFGDFSRFAIDGSVWVTKGDKVLEYLRGEKQDFNISGLVGSLVELGEIYTDGEIDNIYAIDRTNSSLLVIDKEGVYKKSYQSQEFKNATDLVVNEEIGKFYISVGKKVLEGNL